MQERSRPHKEVVMINPIDPGWVRIDDARHHQDRRKRRRRQQEEEEEETQMAESPLRARARGACRPGSITVHAGVLLVLGLVGTRGLRAARDLI